MQNRPVRLHVSWWHERLVDLYEGIRHLHEAANTTQTTIRCKYIIHYYSRTPSNGHLGNTVTSLLRPRFFGPAKRPYIFLKKKKNFFWCGKNLNYRIFYNFTPLMQPQAKLKSVWHADFIDLLLAEPVLSYYSSRPHRLLTQSPWGRKE